ncbi:hypothetical protein HK104_010085 [Borealophlyctis nickersoniae]|nr:hypothetical protein HK104_010085 [Borealophlyctis nickersoniae]
MPRGINVAREKALGKSKIDLLVGDATFLEVKTPLIYLPCEHHPNYSVNEKKFTSYQRLVKHFGDLGQSLASVKDDTSTPKQAIVLMCFLYDAPPFRRPPKTSPIKDITDAAAKAKEAGVQFWQINMKINPTGVTFLRAFRLEHDY